MTTIPNPAFWGPSQRVPAVSTPPLPSELVIEQSARAAADIALGVRVDTVEAGDVLHGGRLDSLESLQFNVKDYGAVGDGVADDTAAFVAMFAALPTPSGAWSDIGRGTAPGSVIEFGTGKTYLLTASVTIGGNKNFIVRGNGSRIAYTGVGTHAFVVTNTPVAYNQWSFQDVTFDTGGVQIGGFTTGNYSFHRCDFTDSPNAAIEGAQTSGGIVNVAIEDCTFHHNKHGIYTTAHQSDMWKVMRCKFFGQTEEDIVYGSSSTVIADCDFELRPVANFDKPFIRLTGSGNTNGIRIVRNRFGPENTTLGGTVFAPPREAIVLGDVAAGGTIDDVTITGNRFLGSNTGRESATESDVAIVLNARPSRINIKDNSFGNYRTALVSEAWVATTPASGAEQNVWRDNLTRAFSPTVFTDGGVGFNPDWPQASAVLPSGTRNLLGFSQTLSSWTLTRCTATQDAIGPDGTANTGWTLARNAAGNVQAGASVTAPAVDGPLTLSVWARSGTSDNMRMNVTVNGVSRLHNARTIRLTPDWRRYSVTVPRVLTTDTLTVTVHQGPTTETATTGTIVLYGPQLEAGPNPSPVMLSPTSAPRASRKFQGQMIGNAAHSYGTAAPVSGRYEVGDVVWNTAPAAGGFVGWVCTAAGSPGTWKTFGSIAA